MDKLAELFGLGAPFAAAAAVYALFNFLDNKASQQANDAIAAWIDGKEYRQIDLSTGVVAAFNNLYGERLLKITSFLRSAALSGCALIVYTLLTQPTYLIDAQVSKELFIIVLPLIIVSDYFSLFAIRRILKISKNSIWISLGLAFLCGIAAVTFVLLIIDLFFSIALDGLFGARSGVIASVERVLLHPIGLIQMLADPQIRWLIVPATFVDVWLPLLLLGALANKAINGFFRATGAARWFLEKGDKHSLEAIGIMASVLVFAAAAIYKIAIVVA